ncbi:hypothetical protein HYPSUDRAFT_43988 [Hypholoma sublateritium FD-334 SS-4]|uniref:Uncharacterized protein n=1 Tax=Hypholoma sublateritium (strain FD-334 SS-4) TaxID=945553 RepID=A0A0D2NLJ0_HYPSF|nr:hypothetical protein HYPSUDRAFT_43988 [Hypholoma sublateritium FD-334 SS-4]
MDTHPRNSYTTRRRSYEDDRYDYNDDPDYDQCGDEIQSTRVVENFKGASGFVIDGGDFSTVAGNVYHGADAAPQNPRPRPPNVSSRTSYFENTSNFAIRNGKFMSVGGDVYDRNPEMSLPNHERSRDRSPLRPPFPLRESPSPYPQDRRPNRRPREDDNRTSHRGRNVPFAAGDAHLHSRADYYPRQPVREGASRRGAPQREDYHSNNAPRARQDRESIYTTSIHPPSNASGHISMHDNMGSYRSHRTESDDDSAAEEPIVHDARRNLENLTLSPFSTTPNIRGSGRAPGPSASPASFQAGPIAPAPYDVGRHALPTPSASQVSFNVSIAQPYNVGQYALPTPITEPLAQPYEGGPNAAQVAVNGPDTQPQNVGPYASQAPISDPIGQPYNDSGTAPAAKKKNKFLRMPFRK